MFDFEKNLLSTILILSIGVLVAIGLVSFIILGRANVDRIQAAGSSQELLARSLAQRPSLEEISAYLSVIEQPVFFADRRLPVMQLADGTDDDDIEPEPEPEPEAEIPELEAVVAGIIITPESRLALVTDRGSNETLLLSEGMVMAGDKSAWKVESIQPRTVDFSTEGGRRARLEMEVETRALKSGQPVAVARAERTEAEPEIEPGDAGDNDAEAEARARAEEIRRRVAERRAQLRAEAERRAQRGNGN